MSFGSPKNLSSIIVLFFSSPTKFPHIPNKTDPRLIKNVLELFTCSFGWLLTASKFKARLSLSHWMVRDLQIPPALSNVGSNSVRAAWWACEREEGGSKGGQGGR